MSDEIKRDKSPNCPRISLEDAVELARKLHAKLGKATVKQEVAAGPLGYSGINGASLGTIAALGSYGLIDKERGGTLRISNLALKILHPQSPASGRAAIQAAAKGPKVFAGLLSEGFHHSDEGVIANHLVHLNFTPDTARKVASVFVRNVKFADLSDAALDSSTMELSQREPMDDDQEQLPSRDTPTTRIQNNGDASFRSKPPASPSPTSGVSSELPIPLDNGLVARVPYPMTEETFDLLIGTLQLWKKRLIVPTLNSI